MQDIEALDLMLSKDYFDAESLPGQAASSVFALYHFSHEWEMKF